MHFEVDPVFPIAFIVMIAVGLVWHYARRSQTEIVPKDKHGVRITIRNGHLHVDEDVPAGGRIYRGGHCAVYFIDMEPRNFRIIRDVLTSTGEKISVGLKVTYVPVRERAAIVKSFWRFWILLHEDLEHMFRDFVAEKLNEVVGHTSFLDIQGNQGGFEAAMDTEIGWKFQEHGFNGFVTLISAAKKPPVA